MSRGVNKFIGIGTVGKDPETRYMPNGSAVSSISIAVNESWKDKDGQKQERTEWIRIVFFNRLAEIVGEYVRKGAKVYVEGQLRTRSYEKDGQTVYATEIVASEMQMLDSRNGGPASAQRDEPAQDDYRGHAGSNQPNPTYGGQQPARTTAPAPRPADFDNFDDDIPF